MTVDPTPPLRLRDAGTADVDAITACVQSAYAPWRKALA